MGAPLRHESHGLHASRSTILCSRSNFEPAVMRELFDYAANCAAAGRLWVTPETAALERGERPLPGVGQAAMSAIALTPNSDRSRIILRPRTAR